MNAAYIPQAGSIAARALAHLQTLPDGVEIGSGPLAEALGITSNIVNVSLVTATKHGIFARDKRHDRIYWRLGPNVPLAGPPPAAAPPPEPANAADLEDAADDDAAPIARTIPSDAVEPIPGLVQQSWCPVAQPAESLSSGGEPVPPPPRPAAPPALGLGWMRAPEQHAAVDEYAASSAAAPAPRSTAGASSAEAGPSMPAWLDSLEPHTPPKGAEAACAPVAPCGRDDATPNNGVVPQGPDDGFRCALWSNGMLDMLTTEGERILLNADDTRGLLRYVGDMLSARARAAA